MNKAYIIVISLLLSAQALIASASHYSNCTSASEHLIEVNPEWKLYVSEIEDLVNFPINFNSDTERIRFHIECVVLFLKQKSTSKLSETQKLNRAKLLDELYIYGIEQVFPINTYHNERTPYFVDQQNTHCAVAHLLKYTERYDIISEIKSTRNYAFINDMDYYPLESWANTNGFKKNELALIQPAYPSTEFVWNLWGNGQGIEGRINVMKTSPDDSRMIIGGEFTSIDGIEGNNIIAFDGEDFYALGEGVNGEIHDIAISEDNVIYIAGDFELTGTKVNVAYWNDESWVPLSNEADGTIYTLQLFENKLFAGGEFTRLDSMDCSNLAYYNFLEEIWSIDGDDGTEDVFSVNGIVRDMGVNFFDSLIIGGSFNLTGILSTEPQVNRDSCYNLSFWNGNDWEHKYAYENTPEVHCLYANNKIIVGGDLSKDYSIAEYDYSGIWNDLVSIENPLYTFEEDSIIQGITPDGGFAYGSIIPQFFGGGEISINMLHLGWSEFSGGGINSTDGTITAVAKLGSETYFAGTFTHIEDIETNGLAKTDGTVGTHANPTLDLEVISSFNQVSIKGDLGFSAKLSIISNNGNQVISQNLNAGYLDESISLNQLSSGIYYLFVESSDGIFSEKMVVVN